jgi:hypothetical protein
MYCGQGFEADRQYSRLLLFSTPKSIDTTALVVAGDVLYNGVHKYLSESGNGGRDAWRKAIDIVEALRPSEVFREFTKVIANYCLLMKTKRRAIPLGLCV